MAKNSKKALIITTVSGFLPQFELSDVSILQELGFEAHYASNFKQPVYKKSCNYSELGIQTHPIPIQKSPLSVLENFLAFLQLRKLIAENDFALIHCHNPMGGVLARIATIGLKGRRPWLIYTAHGFHFYKGASLWNWICYYTAERILAHQTDCLITINHEDYRCAKRFRLRKDGFVACIPGVGVDITRFQTGGGRLTRQQLHIPEQALFILSVGELNENKNHIAILKAMKQLKDPSIFYGICGTGSPLYRQALLDLAKEWGLENQFQIFGYQEHIEDYLHLADVFAFPSYREGLGIAALEAMAAGCPLITADNRGTREFMIDGYTGIMVAPEDIHGFAKAIRRMKDSEYRAKLSECCKSRAKDFSKEITEKKMRRIYQECERRMQIENSCK